MKSYRDYLYVLFSAILFFYGTQVGAAGPGDASASNSSNFSVSVAIHNMYEAVKSYFFPPPKPMSAPLQLPILGAMPDLATPLMRPDDGSHAKRVHWPKDKRVRPTIPPGFKVKAFARHVLKPEKVYVLPNDDILVVSRHRMTSQISIFRGMNPKGQAELTSVLLKDLHLPRGLLYLNHWLYVATKEGVFRYPYELGQTTITEAPQKVLDLPSNGTRHLDDRNIVANPSATKIYVSVGSMSNEGEFGLAEEEHRAKIFEMNPDGSEVRVFASGLRDPVGMAFYPGTNTLWTTVGESWGFGDELVPDYITKVKDGGFYGWPFSYFGQHEYPRFKGQYPDLVASAITPDFSIGSHTNPSSITFYTGKSFPESYQGGAFVCRTGGRNHKGLQGFDVYFVPFKQGEPYGMGKPFMSGFIADLEKEVIYGRPLDVAVLKDGSILVPDAESGIIWHVTY